MLDLGRVAIAGDLFIQAPDGSGTVSITGDGSGSLRVDASDYPTLRRLAEDARQASPAFGPTNIIQQKNPFGQEILVSVNDKAILRWPAGKRPRVANMVRALRFLAG